MNFRYKILTVAFVLGFSAMMSRTAFSQTSQTKVTLHATQAEIDIWKQRSVNGPYKDEWDRIKGRADAFLANPDSPWPGQTTESCYAIGSGLPGRARHRGLRDAAFVFLLTGNITYRDAALAGLIAQKNQAGTDASKTLRWCSGSGDYNISTWLRILLYGYSYLRNEISAADRTSLDTWFLNWGKYWETIVHNPAAVRFPNRLSDNYSSCALLAACPGSTHGITHFGGSQTYKFNGAWNAEATARTAFFAAVGVLLDNATLKDRAKRFVQEWLKFAVFPGNVVFEQWRWAETGYPQRAFAYEGATIGSILTIVDHLGRAGDTSLFNYSTTDGMFGTEGGPKSLLGVLRHYAGLTNGTIIHYASTTAATDPATIINPSGKGGNQIEYIFLAPGNIYYKDPNVKAAYTRPLPSIWNTGGYDVRDGDWGTYPAIRFMFGLQENSVLPYSPHVGVPAPAAPTNVTITIP